MGELLSYFQRTVFSVGTPSGSGLNLQNNVEYTRSCVFRGEPSSGILTNVVFFSKGELTKETWVYDARRAFRRPTSTKPLRREELAEFVRCFGDGPAGDSVRRESDAAHGRWRRYSSEELSDASYDFNQITGEATDPNSTKTHLELINQVEADLVDALANIRTLKQRRMM